MEYTRSEMPKLTETYRLIKRSFTTIRSQAEWAHRSFLEIVDEFKLTKSKILNIGAGTRGDFLILFDKTNYVIGIDKYDGSLRQGFWKALKNTSRKTMFDPIFYYNIKKLNDGYLNRNRKNILMDAMNLGFANCSFDFVFSRFVLEHIEDIKGFAEEVNRVLRLGGKTYHVFDLYTTLGGAHSLDWRKYDPWQHLTGHVKANAYINKYRLEKYKNAFKRVFGKENVELRTKIDRSYKNYLTPQLRMQLNAYSEEELLTRPPVIVAIKTQ